MSDNLIHLPYFSQRDNIHKPSVTCNITDIAMILSYFNIKSEDPSKQLEDEIYEKLNGGPWTEWAKRLSNNSDHPEQFRTVLVEIFNQYSNQFQKGEKKDITFSEMKNNIDKGIPMIMVGIFPVDSSIANSKTISHYVVLCGYENDMETLIVHDSWGSTANYKNINGAFSKISQKNTLKWFAPEGNKKTAVYGILKLQKA